MNTCPTGQLSLTRMALIDNAIRLGEWKRKDQWEHYASLFHCTVVPMNDIALSLLKDAHEELKKSKRYKHNVKHLARSAERAWQEYERLLYLESELNRYGDRRAFLMDYMDSWQESMKHDIDIFRFSISAYLLKLGYDKENTLMTLVFSAHVMLEYACTLWDYFWKTINERTGLDLSQEYKAARLTSVYNYWRGVSQSLDPHDTINLDKDKNCRTAFDIIQRKATSADIINKAGEQALDYNEDVRRWTENYDKNKEDDKRQFLNTI